MRYLLFVLNQTIPLRTLFPLFIIVMTTLPSNLVSGWLPRIPSSCFVSSPPHSACPERHKDKFPLAVHSHQTECRMASVIQATPRARSPPRAVAPAGRSRASAAALWRRRRDAPGALWSGLSVQLPARAPASRPGASEAPPPDTWGRKRTKFSSAGLTEDYCFIY